MLVCFKPYRIYLTQPQWGSPHCGCVIMSHEHSLSTGWSAGFEWVELNCNLHHREECWSLQGGGGTCAFCECKQRRLIIIHKRLSWPRGQIVNRRVIFAPALLLSYTQVIFPFFPLFSRLAGSRWPRWKRWYPRPAWSAWTSRPPWTPRPRWSKLFLHAVSGWVCLSYVLVCLWSVRKLKKTGRWGRVV